MITAEPQVSTADESLLPHLIRIWPPDLSYFVVQQAPQAATQYIGLSSPEAPIDVGLSFDVEGSTAVFLTSAFAQKEESSHFTQPIYRPIHDRSHAPIPHTHISFYHDISDTISPHAVTTFFNDLRMETAVIDFLDAYRGQQFDADVAYDFMTDLDTFIHANGASVIRIITDLASRRVLDEDLVSEALRALGRMENQATKEQRYQVLMRFIRHDSAIVRDAAVSGLSFLDDARALPHLRMLLQTEIVPVLNNNIRVAIESLESD